MANPEGRRWADVKNMFCLMIGIDDYQHSNVMRLKGAVADANEVAAFVQNTLGVLPSRILNLRNEEASRKGIESAFRSLWENPSIARDDPILIYYAGHGVQMPRPETWETGGAEMIQGLLPYDADPQDSDTRTIFPIPDRTVGTWLNMLSHEKGSNITVIFDCCHSASGARSDEQELERAEVFHGSLPNDLDNDYMQRLDETVPLGFLNQHARSHMFIAACGAQECAREVHGRGRFTQELLTTLEEEDADQLSFVELMKRLKPIHQQTPQCEGHFRNRLLFRNTLKHAWGIFQVSRNELGTYRIDAGTIHGVDEGSLFDVYKGATCDSEGTIPLCTLHASRVFLLYTEANIVELTSEEVVIESGFARQISKGRALKVHFTPACEAMMSTDDVLDHHDIRRRVEVVHGDAESVDFIVDIEGTNVAFDTNLKATAEYQFKRLPEVVPANPKCVAYVLRAASHWVQHLNTSTRPSWIDGIELDFFPLETTRDETGVINRKRMDTIMSHDKPNTVFLHVQPDNEVIYGMVIQNNTVLDLHVSIVMFDIDNLAINPCFSGAIGVDVKGNADPYLPQGKSLTIGYGNGGGLPFSWDPPKGVNVTFLKLYFTTMPMELGWLEQESPFELSSARAARTPKQVNKIVTALGADGATTLLTVGIKDLLPVLEQFNRLSRNWSRVPPGQKEHTVYEAELVGVLLGMELLRTVHVVGSATVGLDNQGANKAMDLLRLHDGAEAKKAAHGEGSP
ncbi:caspase domain-containing protein [Gautieria morchelliformis]|nr:caspase domain-containing protein [Gautieria morchelliformis]